MEKESIEQLNKWRLILGKFSKERISFEGGSSLHYMDMEEVLDFLYAREYGEENDIRKDSPKERSGGSGDSQITITTWLQKIRTLFPKKTIEIMEHHALDKYGFSELLTDKEVLEKLEPNRELLKTILSLKHMMKGDVLETAKRIVKKVAEEIMEKMENDIKKSLLGRIDRSKSSQIKSIRNFDIKKTIHQNLKHYDKERKQILPEHMYFNSRVRKYNQWRIIIAVDESGSMLDSVIHSAIMAGVFAKLPVVDTRLIIFDTNVVDLSGYIDDPVETLMSVQLGGGTNITKALGYASTLIENPHKTMVVLVSDLYEGGGYQTMYQMAAGIIESGAKLIALTALDKEANPNYDKNAAARFADLGAEVAAMTPEHLADWIGKIIS